MAIQRDSAGGSRPLQSCQATQTTPRPRCSRRRRRRSSYHGQSCVPPEFDKFKPRIPRRATPLAAAKYLRVPGSAFPAPLQQYIESSYHGRDGLGSPPPKAQVKPANAQGTSNRPYSAGAEGYQTQTARRETKAKRWETARSRRHRGTSPDRVKKCAAFARNGRYASNSVVEVERHKRIGHDEGDFSHRTPTALLTPVGPNWQKNGIMQHSQDEEQGGRRRATTSQPDNDHSETEERRTVGRSIVQLSDPGLAPRADQDVILCADFDKAWKRDSPRDRVPFLRGPEVQAADGDSGLELDRWQWRDQSPLTTLTRDRSGSMSVDGRERGHDVSRQHTRIRPFSAQPQRKNVNRRREPGVSIDHTTSRHRFSYAWDLFTGRKYRSLEGGRFSRRSTPVHNAPKTAEQKRTTQEDTARTQAVTEGCDHPRVLQRARFKHENKGREEPGEHQREAAISSEVLTGTNEARPSALQVSEKLNTADSPVMGPEPCRSRSDKSTADGHKDHGLVLSLGDIRTERSGMGPADARLGHNQAESYVLFIDNMLVEGIEFAPEGSMADPVFVLRVGEKKAVSPPANDIPGGAGGRCRWSTDSVVIRGMSGLDLNNKDLEIEVWDDLGWLIARGKVVSGHRVLAVHNAGELAADVSTPRTPLFSTEITCSLQNVRRSCTDVAGRATFRLQIVVDNRAANKHAAAEKNRSLANTETSLENDEITAGEKTQSLPYQKRTGFNAGASRRSWEEVTDLSSLDLTSEDCGSGMESLLFPRNSGAASSPRSSSSKSILFSSDGAEERSVLSAKALKTITVPETTNELRGNFSENPFLSPGQTHEELESNGITSKDAKATQSLRTAKIVRGSGKGGKMRGRTTASLEEQLLPRATGGKESENTDIVAVVDETKMLSITATTGAERGRRFSSDNGQSETHSDSFSSGNQANSTSYGSTAHSVISNSEASFLPFSDGSSHDGDFLAYVKDSRGNVGDEEFRQEELAASRLAVMLRRRLRRAAEKQGVGDVTAGAQSLFQKLNTNQDGQLSTEQLEKAIPSAVRDPMRESLSSLLAAVVAGMDTTGKLSANPREFEDFIYASPSSPGDPEQKQGGADQDRTETASLWLRLRRAVKGSSRLPAGQNQSCDMVESRDVNVTGPQVEVSGSADICRDSISNSRSSNGGSLQNSQAIHKDDARPSGVQIRNLATSVGPTAADVPSRQEQRTTQSEARKTTAAMKEEREIHTVESGHCAEALGGALFGNHDPDDTGNVSAEVFREVIARLILEIGPLLHEGDLAALCRRFKLTQTLGSKHHFGGDADTELPDVVSYRAFTAWLNPRDIGRVVKRISRFLRAVGDPALRSRYGLLPTTENEPIKPRDPDIIAVKASDEEANFHLDTNDQESSEGAAVPEFVYSEGTGEQHPGGGCSAVGKGSAGHERAAIVRMFRVIDRDSSGRISEQELLKAVNELGLPLTMAEARLLVAEYGAGSRGGEELTFHDFDRMVSRQTAPQT